VTTGGCGAPVGGAKVRKDGGKEAVVQGRVTSGGAAVPSGYARLLNDGGEFVAEVPLGEDGGFRFFAAPGRADRVRGHRRGHRAGGRGLSAAVIRP
jgi:hypothetical protein